MVHHAILPLHVAAARPVVVFFAGVRCAGWLPAHDAERQEKTGRVSILHLRGWSESATLQHFAADACTQPHTIPSLHPNAVPIPAVLSLHARVPQAH